MLERLPLNSRKTRVLVPPGSIEILERLVAFPTVSRRSNAELMAYIRDLLRTFGIDSRLIRDPIGGNDNLTAVIGPPDRPGVMLSGHTDVVPVDGQAWTSDPFQLVRRDGRLVGRGTADMKGFVACAIRAACSAASRPLVAPLRLSLSCDEEIGCVGVRSLLASLAQEPVRPGLCIVGEPTSMRVAIGHKGKVALRARFHGSGGHSACAPHLLNAIHLATDFVQRIRERQDDLAHAGADDSAYEVPYSTLHVGTIHGGEALNIVAAQCELDFEARLVAADDADTLVAALTADAEAIAGTHRARFKESGAVVEVLNAYPGLDTAQDSPGVAFVTRLLGTNDLIKVDFGTEAGLFARDLGIPTVICGPGSMEQGHRADEYVEISQIGRCDRMLDALLDRLCV